MELFLKNILSAGFIFIIIRVATPIIFASMAALISTKAGVVNITIDGTMLMSALTGVLVSARTQSLMLGCIGGLLTGMVMGGFLAFFHVKMHAPSNTTGVAMNLFANGFSVFLCVIFAGDKGSTSKLQSLSFPTVNIPFVEDIPVLGTIVSGHNLFTYLAFLTVIGVYILIYKTPLGLRIRAVGEYDTAAKSVGENPDKIKIIALVIAGAIAAMGGMFLSMGYVSWFTRNMTGARGFIGVAANAIGRENPWHVFWAAMLFGLAQAFANTIQILQFPAEIIAMMPYVITLVVMAANSMRESAAASAKKKKIIAELD